MLVDHRQKEHNLEREPRKIDGVEVKSAPKPRTSHIHRNVADFIIREVFVGGSRHPHSLAEEEDLETVADLVASCLDLPEECLTHDSTCTLKESNEEAIKEHSHRIF